MNMVTVFKGTLQKNFLGNIIFQFQLPSPCLELHICLTCHAGDRERAAALHDKEAEEAFLSHFGRLPDALETKELLSHMKTEIQLAAFLSGRFLGNVHRPGNIKEMHFAPDAERTPGCMETAGMYHGLLKLVVNSFGVLEEEISYELKIICVPVKGGREEKNMASQNTWRKIC